MMTSDSTHPSPKELICPRCQHPYRPGELVCPACETLLSTSGKTRKFEAVTQDNLENQLPLQLTLVLRQELTFEIEGQPVVLPKGTLTVGRSVMLAGANPDIDLNPFDGEDQGVSHLHIKIQRRGILIYITDLQSTNGTLLNNHPLTPGVENILRHNDDLQLGQLKIKIKIEDISTPLVSS